MMMDGMDSIRRTIYDKFGNVMKTFKADIEVQAESEISSEGGFQGKEILTEDTSVDGAQASDALWDLSELDPEIYEDVFESTLLGGTPSLLQNTVMSSKAQNDTPDDSDSAVMEPHTLEKPRNFQTVSLDDIGDSEDQNSQVELDPSKESSADEEQPPVLASNIGNDSAEESEMSDLFAEKIEVRPQVRQLLDKYGTVSMDQLTKELKEVSELLSRK
jgi:hypothetical protein